MFYEPLTTMLRRSSANTSRCGSKAWTRSRSPTSLPISTAWVPMYAPTSKATPPGKVRRWVERNKRMHLRFTPTSSSWLNLVERSFAPLSEQRLRRGVFTSVCHLEKSLRQYLDTYNENPRPLVWTKSTEEIVEKVGRAKVKLAAAS